MESDARKMGPDESPLESDEDLSERALSGNDTDALGQLLDRAHPRLKRMLGFRIDARAGGRFDADDVLQEAFMEAARRLEEFRAQRAAKGEAAMPFFLWLRLICQQSAVRLHRQHFGAGGRDVRKEAAAPPAFADTSLVLTAALISNSTSPTAAVARQERADRLRAALDLLAADDRELMVLRHLEGLSNRETAAVLGITESNASRKNVRLLLRLREIAQAQKIDLTGFAALA